MAASTSTLSVNKDSNAACDNSCNDGVTNMLQEAQEEAYPPQVQESMRVLADFMENWQDPQTLRQARTRLEGLVERLGARIHTLEEIVITVTTVAGEAVEIGGLQPDHRLAFLQEQAEKKLTKVSGMTKLASSAAVFDQSCLFKSLKELGIVKGSRLTLVVVASEYTWEGNVQVQVSPEGLGRLRASRRETGVVSSQPSLEVAFTVGRRGSQRNIGLCVGKTGHARSHFTLIAEVSNDVFAGNGLTKWDVARFGGSSEGDFLHLRFDGQLIHFERNGTAVCPARPFELEQGQELYAYASIHHEGGEINDLQYGQCACPRKIANILKQTQCSRVQAKLALRSHAQNQEAALHELRKKQ